LTRLRDSEDTVYVSGYHVTQLMRQRRGYS
jgi:hypothetical protein